MSKVNKRKENYIARIDHLDQFYASNQGLVSFSFKYFQYNDGEGQSFEEWEKDRILSDLNNKLKFFSGKTKKSLLVDQTLVIYGVFPTNTKFKEPKYLVEYPILWARLRLTGRRRLIGFFVNNGVLEDIFYIVFLDKNHEFYPVKIN